MNVFDCGVSIVLVDKVSAALGSIARQFTHSQTAANALNARLKSISGVFQSGLIMGAGGAALAAPLVAATKAAQEYQHQLNQMVTAGMSHREVTDSLAASWKTAGNVITSSVVGNLKTIADLRTVFGQTNEAIEYMPTFAKMQGAYSSVLEGRLAKHSDELTFSAAKAIDMIGKVSNSQEFNQQIGMMFRATVASLGRVTPSDYQTTYKYMRQAKYGLSDEFRYKILPELILENKGSGGSGTSGGVGPQIAALYRFGVQGIMNKRSAQLMQQMGLVPAGSILKTTTTGTTLKGGLLENELLSKNPLEWVRQVFLPHLEKHFNIKATDTDKLINATNQIFKGNQLATSLVGELIKKQQQYIRFGRLYDKTLNMDEAYQMGMKHDPAANYKALGAALENLKVSIGENIVPVLVPMINKLSSSIQSAAIYFHNHPTFTKVLTSVVALTSGLLIFGGAIQVIRAGFMGLSFIMGALAIPALTTAFVTLGPWIIGIAAAVGILVASMKAWDIATRFVTQHQAFFTHVATQAARAIDQLSASIGGLIGAIGNTLKQIGNAVSAINPTAGNFITPLSGKQSKELAMLGSIASFALNAGMANALSVNEKTAKQDAAYWATKAHPSKPAIINKTEIHQTNNITMTPVKGHDHDACIKNMSKNLLHAASAGSGNSVGRSLNTGGATRP